SSGRMAYPELAIVNLTSACRRIRPFSFPAERENIGGFRTRHSKQYGKLPTSVSMTRFSASKYPCFPEHAAGGVRRELVDLTGVPLCWAPNGNHSGTAHCTSRRIELPKCAPWEMWKSSWTGPPDGMPELLFHANSERICSRHQAPVRAGD